MVFISKTNKWETNMATTKKPIRKTTTRKTTSSGLTVSQALAKTKAKEEAFGADTTPHLIVKARAGTGKTFTLVLGIAWLVASKLWDMVSQALGSTPKPSPQQQAVWEAMAEGKTPATVTYIAFNKSIVYEFSSKYQWLVNALGSVGIQLQFSTIHSLGFGAVKQAYGRRVRVNKWKTRNLIEQILGVDTRELIKTPSGEVFVKATEALVNLCKLTLTEATPGALDGLSIRYGIETNGQRDKVFGLVPQVLDLARTTTDEVDFSDMVWLPVVNNLPVYSSDLLLIDEAQDLNRCQQELALKAGRRLVLCGDDMQAIYGFAGADCESLPRMEARLAETPRGVKVLPLTVTRRCGKAIVAEAQKLVPDYEAHKDNGPGQVLTATLEDTRKNLAPGNMVLCRTNAPLVGLCFKLIREGRKANIQGRDIGEGLSTLIRKLKPTSVDDLLDKLQTWYDTEAQRIRNRKNPDEEALITLEDKYFCLQAFTEGALTVDKVHEQIGKVFEDGAKGGVLLSSVHRAKGMEAKKVWILHPEKMPHPMAKTPEAQAQEINLKYVAITRAIETLTWVRG